MGWDGMGWPHISMQEAENMVADAKIRLAAHTEAKLQTKTKGANIGTKMAAGLPELTESSGEPLGMHWAIPWII